MKLTRLNIFLFILVAMGHIQPAQAIKTFVHPGIPFTQSDLDLLKTNISKEPWKTGYQALAADSRSQLTYTMQGPYATVSRAPNLYNTAWINDMIAIHNLTFMWVFTGNDSYAAKATQILDSWAVTNTTWAGDENMLDIGDNVLYLVPAADILKSLYSGWNANNTAHVNNYFANVLYPTSWVPNPLRDNNKGALQLKIALSIAAFLDDEAKWNQAIETYRMDAGGGLRCSLPNGETGDTGRDDHWFVQAYGLAWGAEVAWKQGVDLYSEFSNRLLSIGELYNHYSISPSDLTFIPFGGYANYWTTWGIAPGVQHVEPFNNIIHAAYALRKGISTPYTDQMRTLVGTENALSFLYNKSEDASTATSLTPIVYPGDQVQSVAYLTDINIGNPGIAGSALYNAGTWTVNGAGTSVVNSVNYTFKPMKGDVAIIAKVAGNSMSSANAGLMIRESLSSTSNYVSINLLGAGGMSSSAGGASAQTVYAHTGPSAPWWLKLERVGNRYFTYHSQDGVNWTNNAQYIMSLPDDVYIGLYTVSNNTSSLNTATFTNVEINNTFPAGSPEINSTTTVNATLETTLSYTITATGTPTGYSATGLPDGLNLDAATGIISGTPTTVGQSIVTLGATNANGTGTATLIINVTNNTAPAAITGLSASVVNTTKISISWTASANATSYNVKRSLTSGGSYTNIQTGITGTSFVDASPAFGVNNYYIVTALSGNLESTASNEVYASPAPAIPANLVATSISGEIDLTWDIALGASTYNVKRAIVSGGPYTLITNVASNSYKDMGLTDGNSYYYVVSSSVNLSGGTTAGSDNSTEVFGVPGSTSVTWSGTPISNVFNLASNWNENIVPVNPAIISFNTSSKKTLSNDMNGFVASRIQFNTGASGFKIGGNDIMLNNDLVNNSSLADTLTMNIAISNLMNAYTPGSSIRVTGNIGGAGGILKRGTSALYLSGNNTYSGNTIITGTNGYKWGSTDGIFVAGTGTGTSGAPISGPLGTGKVILQGGAISTELVATNATLYNDIEVAAGYNGYFYERYGTINLYGRLTGGGNIYHDGSDNYAALQLYGDNSGFTGTFIAKLRSGNHRLAFMTPQSGSANANWLLDANGNDCQRLLFGNGTLNFGSLSGRGLIRNDATGSVIISIGALNSNTNYSGTISQANANNKVGVEKVGTGTLIFSGNNTYALATTVQNGTYLLNNNASTGVFSSPVIVNAGAFGGTGKSQNTVIVGNGNGIGAAFVPGTDGTVGTFTTTSTVTLNADATYKMDLNSTTGTTDQIVAGSVVLNNAQLSITNMGSQTIQPGTSFVIINNTGAAGVSGTFNNLSEGAIVSLNGVNFKISYVGGDGNDVTLTNVGTTTDNLEKGASGFSVYPNPVKDYLVVTWNMPMESQNKMQLFDINGRMLLSSVIGGFPYSWNLKDIAPGMYFLKLDGISGLKKIVKQ